MSKFYKGEGVLFQPFSFVKIIEDSFDEQKNTLN
jgi:vacuolar-type H+-ATPase subunit I/STV1